MPLIDKTENILKGKLDPCSAQQFLNFYQKQMNQHSQNIFWLIILIGMALPEY